MARKSKVEAERRKWLMWLARNNYGIDFNFAEDPPCTGEELAAVMQELDPINDEGDGVAAYLWCMQEETGAFRT